MRRFNEHAVSPVVGVMLMLVVVIIIAAIVSAFAGGAVSGTKKAPQAQISAKYSISSGMQISHNGGDSLPAGKLIFMMHDGPSFGQNLEQITSNVIDGKIIYNSKGKQLRTPDGAINFTAFNPGDTLYISAEDTTCNKLQTSVAPWDMATHLADDGYSYTGSKSYANYVAMCIRNNDNVGKTFILDTMDTDGNMISKSDVVISP